ncbi:peptidoglycan/xylan/chitin deacetylase (PgdA/CDA1 family)/2-polyprenyl-3-methyl-5-hydroxy-6-metoxy-1,4-benzoquinol methylase [Bradyrhizobium sp. RT6a]|uniref:glycosyltransferase n=1 Tax=Bradyrhizobium sp. RT6a TaxID=3156381 RepID=UPI003395F089
MVDSMNVSSLSLPESQLVGAPLTSVVIPARNAEETIKRTLQSLVAQTNPSWQALIVDDSSVDTTSAIVSDYAARDSRFIGLKSPERGAAAARNVGISHASGERLLFLDSDDWVNPSFLEKMNGALDDHPDAVAAYCNWCRVFENADEAPDQGDDRIQQDPVEAFARSCATVIHSVLIRKRAVLEAGVFDTSLRTCEDWDLWQRVARLGGSWIHVRERLSYYWMSDRSLTQDMEQMMADARVVIARGFATRESATGSPKGAGNGAPNSGAATAELTYAYFALWCAAFDCGRGREVAVPPTVLATLPQAQHAIDPIVTVLLDGVSVGARLLPSRLASEWSQYGVELTGLVCAIGQAWGKPATARKIQYDFERKILDCDDLASARELSLTLGLRVDLRRLPHVRPNRSVDRLYVYLCNGPHVLALLDVGVLGTVDLNFWITLVTQHLKHLHIREQAGRIFRLTIKIYSRMERLRQFIRSSSASHQNRLQAIRKSMSLRAIPLKSPGEEVSDSRRSRGREPSRDLAREEFWEILFTEEDPWNYGSAYEQEKYSRQLQMLPAEQPKRALELACAEGYFTRQLAPRVERLIAADISTKALERARARCGEHWNVDFVQLDLSADALPQDLDLIVCSEVLYYLKDEAELDRVANRLADALRPGGRLVTAHAFVLKDNMSRTGFDWENPYGAETIARVIGGVPGLALEASMQTELYRVDRFKRLFPGEIISDPQVTDVKTNVPIETEVARFIVWNGAITRRTTVVQTERRERIPILAYHRIATDGPTELAPYRLSPEAFQEQMLWLRRNGYHTINSEQLARCIANDHPFLGRPVLITFDDGYEDFAERAWPILQRNDFSAEVFIVADLVGRRAEWDGSFGLPAPLMDTATIVSLAAEGVAFGSHLASHPRSDGLSTLEVAEELLRSRIQLEKWLGRSVTSLAAPFGCTDQRLRILAAECGYTIGFNTANRAATLKDDPLDLPRIEVRGDCTLETFAASLEACR